MDGLFIELPQFTNHREHYLSDDEYSEFQQLLLANPTCGQVITDTGGLRKIRFSDPRRQKGKRGGIRVIYYFWQSGREFWLFTLYNKDEASDLTAPQKKAIKQRLAALVKEREDHDKA